LNINQTGIFVVLAISIATAITGTAAMSLATPAFANDGHDGQKCKKNEDNNCNHNEHEQKIYAKNECEIKNENIDHSDDNENDNVLKCINLATNIDDSLLENASIFDVTAD
jgi:hypothetical protein